MLLTIVTAVAVTFLHAADVWSGDIATALALLLALELEEVPQKLAKTGGCESDSWAGKITVEADTISSTISSHSWLSLRSLPPGSHLKNSKRAKENNAFTTLYSELCLNWASESSTAQGRTDQKKKAKWRHLPNSATRWFGNGVVPVYR